MRVVASTHPLDVESGGIHQVKPWFTGRLDFAPRVAFSGDDDFPLVGGSLGYVLDRKAAVLVFKRRLHTITLLVFPPDGLAWPAQAPVTVGRLSVVAQSRHGFSVLLWRDGDLGYALVSDVARADLETLATKPNPATHDRPRADADESTERFGAAFVERAGGHRMPIQAEMPPRDLLKLMASRRRGLRLRPGGRRAGARRSRRRAATTSSSCSCPTRTGATAASPTPRPT